MASKVKCDETKFEQTKCMNDRDFLNDLLASEKEITTNTATAITEASNRKLENIKLVGFFDEDSEFMENAFINLLSAISDYLGYVKKDEMIEKYKKAPSIVKRSILEGASRVIDTDLRALVSTVYDCLELAEFDDEDEDDE